MRRSQGHRQAGDRRHPLVGRRHRLFQQHQRSLRPARPDLQPGDRVHGSVDNGYGENFEVVLMADADAVPGTLLVNTAEITPLPGEDSYDDNVSTAASPATSRPWTWKPTTLTTAAATARRSCCRTISTCR